ncbi:conserved hypothetical protein [Ricinus communis]|uniref:Protein kinase domain-containing protein n=1 Tax=Ricinus communis TaxID=3988 RepID=B9SD73_RICCO|nr:conserved hypothetical protein [Ricinus communis]
MQGSVEYPCDGTCKNTVGNYTCHCPLRMHGDGILLKHQRVRIFKEAELAKATDTCTTAYPSKEVPIFNSLENILRIAAETAYALDYLHSLANHPIIHGDVKSANILLDENYTAKVSDLGASVIISSLQADIATKIQGTFGYLDPEYLMTGDLIEKSDVYSFGFVLVELLTGEEPNCSTKSGQRVIQFNIFSHHSKNGNLNQILCFEVTNKEQMEEIEVLAELAKQCLRSSGVKRPSMKEVAEELGQLRKLHESSWDQHNSEEIDRALVSRGSNFFLFHYDWISSQSKSFYLRNKTR